MKREKVSLIWRWLTLAVIIAMMLSACAAPAAAPAGEQPAASGDAAAAAPAADAPAIKEVAREKTLIVMAGGPNQYAQFDNHNPFIPGSDAAFHTGTLPASFEPPIMFNVLTGGYQNWLAESWEYNADFTEITANCAMASSGAM
ncbi:MAG: hypothetical protein ACOYNY_43595, partial [Caldilineaceae bacterium]